MAREIRDRFWEAWFDFSERVGVPSPLIPEWVSVFWFEVNERPVWISWIPWWRRHHAECDRRFEKASRDLLDGGEPDAFRSATGGISYCPSCDYIEATRSKNRLWYHLAIWEGAIDSALALRRKHHR